jgi:hypothetical protein
MKGRDFPHANRLPLPIGPIARRSMSLFLALTPRKCWRIAFVRVIDFPKAQKKMW